MAQPLDRYPDPSVTPEEFERLVAALLGSLGSRLKGLRVTNHEEISTPDGDYDFDATARFEAMGMDFLVLIEAKLHGRPVEREDVLVLLQKLQSTGAQKAVLASSSGFQKGAVDFAAAHNIALVRIVDYGVLFETKAANTPARAPTGILAGIHVQPTEDGRGVRFTTLTEQPDYVAEMLGLPV
jgi:hypothetical protein